MCRNKHLETNPYLVISFMEYLLYPPYCSTLIVLFEDYIKQRRNLKPVNWRQILFLAVRLLFWFFVTELSLHFMRFNAFFNAPFTMMTGLHNYQSMFYILKYCIFSCFHRLHCWPILSYQICSHLWDTQTLCFSGWNEPSGIGNLHL